MSIIKDIEFFKLFLSRKKNKLFVYIKPKKTNEIFFEILLFPKKVPNN